MGFGVEVHQQSEREPAHLHSKKWVSPQAKRPVPTTHRWHNLPSQPGGTKPSLFRYSKGRIVTTNILPPPRTDP